MCSVEAQIIILDVHKYSTYVIEVFGLAFNILVIYLLTTDNKGTGKSYKSTVILHCFMDIGLGIFHILGMFQVEAVGTTTFMTLCGPIQYINVYAIHTWSFIITNFFFSCSIFCGCITTIYRYFVVVRRKTLEIRSVILMCSPMIIISGVIASQYISHYSPLPEEAYNSYKKLLPSTVWARDKVYGEDFIALISPADHKTEPFYNYFSIFSYLAAAILIIIFSILISIDLRKNRGNMSETTLKIEKQIQRTLICQAIFPIALGYIPNISPFFMVLFKVPFQCYIIFVGICITYIPLINPCILLIMTPQYRKKMYQIITRKGQTVVTKTTIIVAHSKIKN
uniref:G_PROTEIN_RECEP_F1_2 domain-containing protein n=1 Tax=Parastrongyloides trichosuri TaxID=131310 RepID=A0A0N4ZX06_PARTI